jgi:uncharacterized C2H2 Zn-finger protein
MEDAPANKCPRCGALLSAERLDHHLTGQERLFCPQHGQVGSLQKTRAHDYRDARPDPDEFE